MFETTIPVASLQAHHWALHAEKQEIAFKVKMLVRQCATNLCFTLLLVFLEKSQEANILGGATSWRVNEYDGLKVNVSKTDTIIKFATTAFKVWW